jgi:hypothetical protein
MHVGISPSRAPVITLHACYARFWVGGNNTPQQRPQGIYNGAMSAVYCHLGFLVTKMWKNKESSVILQKIIILIFLVASDASTPVV